jgi:hypothetical protein
VAAKVEGETEVAAGQGTGTGAAVPRVAWVVLAASVVLKEAAPAEALEEDTHRSSYRMAFRARIALRSIRELHPKGVITARHERMKSNQD